MSFENPEEFVSEVELPTQFETPEELPGHIHSEEENNENKKRERMETEDRENFERGLKSIVVDMEDLNTAVRRSGLVSMQYNAEELLKSNGGEGVRGQKFSEELRHLAQAIDSIRSSEDRRVILNPHDLRRIYDAMDGLKAHLSQLGAYFDKAISGDYKFQMQDVRNVIQRLARKMDMLQEVSFKLRDIDDRHRY